MKRALLIGAIGLMPMPALAEIGSVAAVNRDMDGTPPAGSRRALALGNQVVSDELIQTSRIGSGQLMFLDQTTLTVAPNSDIVLDQYVYDPDTQSGDIAISLTKGALRFIGGRISKNRDAIVRTPSATIGIRGGMTIIKVDENGRTEVFHMGGEYSTIASKSGKGPKVTLSRPSSSASVTPDQFPTFTGIVTAEQLAVVYGGFEGSGDGGSSTLGSLETRGAGANRGGTSAGSTGGGSSSSGGTSTTSRSTSGDDEDTSAGNGGSSRGSGNRSASSGTTTSGGTGVNTGDGTTPGEPPAPTVTEIFEEGIGGLAEQNSGQQDGDQIPPISTSGERPKDAEPEVELSGTFSDSPATQDNPASEPSDPNDFIIGSAPPPPPPPADPPSDPDPVPDPDPDPDPDPGPIINLSGAAFTETGGFFGFDSITQGSLTGEGSVGGSFTESVTINVPESSAEFLTALPETGAQPILFADNLNQTAGVFANQQGVNPGNVASLGEIEAFGFSDLDANFHFYIFAESSFDSQGSGGLVLFGEPSPNQGAVVNIDDSNAPATANTVEAFVLETPLDEMVTGANFSGDGQLLVIANAGEGRYPTIDRVANGGRVIGGSFNTFNKQGGGQDSEFFVLATQPFQQGAGGLRFSGATFSTDTFENLVFVSESNYGTFEDAAGNTVFGPDENYIALSSLFRPSFDSDFVLDPGEDRVLGETSFGDDPFAAVLTRDPSSPEIILDPLAIATGPAALDFDGGQQGQSFPVLVGFASGEAVCSDGNCGNDFDGDGVRTGTYSLDGEIIIGFDDGSLSGNDTNLVFSQFLLEDDETANIGGQVSSQFELNATEGVFIESGYADDRTFATISRPAVSEPNTIIGGVNQQGTIGVATANLAGTGDLFGPGIDTTPQFLSWGMWNAVYNTNDQQGGPREDGVPVGFFVAGGVPDPTLLPTTDVAFYNGFAAGTRVDQITGERTLVGGSSSLVFDFGANSGAFSINIAEFDIVNANAIGLDGGTAFGVAEYSVFNDANGVILDALGAFNAGGLDPVAATSGQFRIEDTINTIEVNGVYGGDKAGQPIN